LLSLYNKMAKIWGLDLGDMKWSKFGNDYMWKNTDYHRRRTKFIIYQCAMILCVVSESLGTAALSGTLLVVVPGALLLQNATDCAERC
jgi:hypothetical protein